MEALTLENVLSGLMVLLAVYAVGWGVWCVFTEFVPELVEEVKEILVNVWKAPRKEKAGLLAMSCLPLIILLGMLRSCVVDNE